jgi:uncharacterized membrane protein YdjX (TVP38/TMEM64 family)
MYIPTFHSKKERNDFYAKSTGIIIFFLLFFYLLIPLIHSPRFSGFVENAGLFGPLMLTLFFVIADVTLPLLGSPGIILSVGLYGLWKGLFIAYFASLISAAINFYLSRKYGRTLIKKLVGKHGVDHVNYYVDRFGKRTLVLGRLFGFPVFEIISYAGGLTSMSFKTYMIITALFGAIPAFTIKTLIFFANPHSSLSILIWTCILSLAGAVSAFITNKVIDYLDIDKKK